MVIAGLERLDTLTPWTRQKVLQLLRIAARNDIPVRRVDSARRTCSEQDAIYSQGREAGGPIATGAAGCRSWHVWGRAVDLHIEGPVEAYRALGELWKSWGGIWGGDWAIGDYGHFEWHPGHDIRDLCPSGAECPVGPFPEDRPLLERPVTQAIIGLGAVSAAGVIAWGILRR